MSKSRTGSRRGELGHLELISYRPHRSWPVQLLLLLWRWAVELALFVVLAVMVVKVHVAGGWPWLVCVAAVMVAPVWPFLVPQSRPVAAGFFWCLVTRHRMRTFFIQSRVYNRSQRLPWIVFIRPTAVGERVWVWLVPGLSVEDFDASIETLAAATWARTARVERSRSVGSLLRVDIVRRDPLMAAASLPSVLIPATRQGQDLEQDARPAGRLDMPRTSIDLTTPDGGGKAGGRGKPVNRMGKAAPSTQDGAAAPSTLSVPPVVTRGGEDVSDYV